MSLIATADVTLDSFHDQNANLGGRPILQFFGTGTAQNRPLLKFEVSTLGVSSAEIESASLQLYRTAGLYGNREMDVSLFALTTNWDEGSDFANNRPGNGAGWLEAATGVPWNTPGGDFDLVSDFGNGPDGLVSQTLIEPFQSAGWLSFDATGAVKAWLNGDIPNFGLGFVVNSGSFTEHQVASTENGNATLHPRLVVQTRDVSSPVIELDVDSAVVAEDAGSVSIQLNRLGPTTGSISADVATQAGTALGGSDYTSVAQTVTFADGETTQTVVIPIIDDSDLDPGEEFSVVLSNPSPGVSLGLSTATIAITDNEVAPQPGVLSFDTSFLTVDESAGTALIQINRTGGLDGAVSITISTGDQSASAGLDYGALAGLVTFADGEATRTVSISILQDEVDEPHEVFSINLNNPTGGATVSGGTMEVTILDDDLPPVGAVTTLTATGDTTLDNFHHLSANIGGRSRLQFYNTNASQYRGLLDFDLTSLNLTGSEILTASLELYHTAGLYGNRPMDVTVHAVSTPWDEGDGFANNQPGDGASWLNATTGTAWTTPGGDIYSAFDFGMGANGVVAQGVIPSWTNEAWVTFDVTTAVQAWLDGDIPNHGLLLIPANGRFTEHTFHSTEFSDAALRPRLVVTRTAIPTQTVEFVVDSTTVSENVGTVNVAVHRVGSSVGEASVNFTTISGTATADADFTASSGTITFADGQTATTIPISITEDGDVEPTETFSVQLSDPSGGTAIGRSSIAVSIADNDQPNHGSVALGQSAATVNETAGTVTLTIVRTGGTDGQISVAYTTVAGSASPGSDYTETSGLVVIEDGESIGQVVVPILNDGLLEGDESFGFAIDQVIGGALLIQPRTAQVTIIDDESPTPGNGNGLLGEYFSDSTLTNLTYSRIDPVVDFNWGSTSPAAILAADTFSARWTGQIEPHYSETYTFRTWSDDGVRLWIDNQLIIDQWNLHSPTFHTGLISLVGGQRYDVRMEFFENTGGAVAQLAWTSASQPLEVVPQSQLYSTPIPASVVGDVSIAADNTFELYVNGQLIGSGSDWTTASVLQDVVLTEGANVIAIRATDTGGAGGVFFDMAIDSVNITSNSQWLVSETLSVGWEQPAFDASAWVPATTYGGAGAAPWESVTGLSPTSNAVWIWSDDNNADNEVFLRYEVVVASGQINVPGFGSEHVVQGLVFPTAIDFAPDGSMFIAQQNGVVRLRQNGQLLSTPFIDISAQVNGVRDRGLLGMAVHPSFPTQPYVYLAFTYDPPETVGQTGLAAPDAFGNRVSRVIRVSADPATGFTTALPGSEFVILGQNSTWANISHPELDSTDDNSIDPSCGGGTLEDCLPSDSQSHSIGALAFGLDGMLYVSNGDGTSYGRVDPRTVRVQNLDSLSGKLLRIDPLTGDGLSDNPLFDASNPNANRSKVYSYGLRNPFRFAIHPVSGEPYIGDVGWTAWEEINFGRGANFGWPYYEGGNGQSLPTGGYSALPEAQAFYVSGAATEAPLWSHTHAAGARAVIVGDFYTGSVYPSEWSNTLFFTDFGEPTIRALQLNPDGTLNQARVVYGGGGAVSGMRMGPDGHMYFVELFSGAVGRITFTPAGTIQGGSGGTGASAGENPLGASSNKSLEDFTIRVDGSTAEFIGTSGSDHFVYSAAEPNQVIVNGVVYGLSSAVTQIRIQGGGGFDTIDVIESSSPDGGVLVTDGLVFQTGRLLVGVDEFEELVITSAEAPQTTVLRPTLDPTSSSTWQALSSLGSDWSFVGSDVDAVFSDLVALLG